MLKHFFCLSLLMLSLSPAGAQKQSTSWPALPYSPSLDLASMDKSIDPCVDLYSYSCGGWQKKNPIPPDQTSWSVYGKLYEDNLTFLRGMLEQAAQPNDNGNNNKDQRNAVSQKIGDFYAACMDESAAEKKGISPIQPELDAIAQVKSAKELTPLVARLQLIYSRYSYSSSMLFSAGSTQDPDDSEHVIADVDQGGLGMPDRDYYIKDDPKSIETRQRYLQHVQKVFEMIGDSPAAAKKNAET